MKKIFVTVSAVIILVVSLCVIMGMKRDVNIVVDGESIDNANGVIINDTTFVPVRGVFEKMGYTVDWNETDREAVIQNKTHTVVIPSDSEVFYVDQEEMTPPQPQRILDGSLYLPLRAISEAVGAKISWDGDTYTVNIITPNPSLELRPEPVPDVEPEPKPTPQPTAQNFAYELNAKMPEDKNYVFSPLSIKLAMAMAANGAEDKTLQEMTDTLGITDLEDYNAWVKQLMSAYSNNEGKPDIRIANSIWLNTDKANGGKFSQSFRSRLTGNYSAEVEEVNSKDAVSKINNWVSDNTNGLIKEITDNSNFLAAIINACYFKGEWVRTFDENYTYPQEFTYRDGSKEKIDFMHINDNFKYYEEKNMQMVELPYKGNSNISMYVVLNGDKREDFSKYFDKCSYEEVNISMPKFKIEFDVTLNDILKEMGIKLAFDGENAQLRSMLENYNGENIFVDKVLHKAYIDVDETGTEAAAVTAVMVDAAAAYNPEPPKEFNANKPFTYIIRDNDSGEILFMGEFACK